MKDEAWLCCATECNCMLWIRMAGVSSYPDTFLAAFTHLRSAVLLVRVDRWFWTCLTGCVYLVVPTITHRMQCTYKDRNLHLLTVVWAWPNPNEESPFDHLAMRCQLTLLPRLACCLWLSSIMYAPKPDSSQNEPHMATIDQSMNSAWSKHPAKPWTACKPSHLSWEHMHSLRQCKLTLEC